jgi:hypothetical protein
MHKPLAKMLLLVLVRDKNTWTLLDRKRQIYTG